MPSKLELALCISYGSMIDIFDIHTGIHVKHIAGNFGNVAILHDSLLVCCDNTKNILSVYNFRLNRLKWKCAIPKETKLGPLCVSSTSSISTSSKSTPCDPRFLFCGSTNGHIYCWCLLTGKLLNIFKAHLQCITALSMSKDGNLLISGSNDCLCKVWKLSSIIINNSKNTNDGGINSIKPFLTWNDHILGITDIFCASNERIFTCSRDCTVKIYSLLSKSLISSLSFPNPLSCLRVDAANIYLLVASTFGELFRINLINHPKFNKNSDIQHIANNDSKTILCDVTYSATKKTQKVGITGLDISYDGRLAVSSHANGAVSIWDIKYGSKVSVLNKNRECYDQIILVCDRLGAFAASEADVKYEKFSLVHKHFPIAIKKFYALSNNEDGASDDDEKEIVFGADNKQRLIYPPKYLEVNVPSGCSSASELAVNKEQSMSDVSLGFDSSMIGYETSKYGVDSWWNDDGFLNRIDDEFNRLHAFNGNSQGFIVEMNDGSGMSVKTDKKMKKMAGLNAKNMDRNMQKLLDENQRLKGEIAQWKSLHADLYKFTSEKVVNNDDDIQMFD